MAFDREKFKQLVHYVVWRAGKRDWFGATKLNKVLWFADARRYVESGRSITGATYIREKHGPVPKAMMPVRAELEGEGAIRVTRLPEMTRIIALVPPDTSRLSPEELKHADWWINHIDQDHTADSISDESHDYSWEIARMGEEIPMHAIFANRIRDPNDSEMEWAKDAARRRGLR